MKTLEELESLGIKEIKPNSKIESKVESKSPIHVAPFRVVRSANPPINHLTKPRCIHGIEDCILDHASNDVDHIDPKFWWVAGAMALIIAGVCSCLR